MTTKSENEAVFYARIGDPSGFAHAVDHESHEQWEFKGPNGRVRIRATARGDDVAYHETIKTINAGADTTHDHYETTVTIDKDYFDAWKRALGITGVFKVRYVFLSKEVILTIEGEDIVLPEIKYEVDVFVTPAGERSKWCKIDIELDAVLAYLADKHPGVQSVDLTVALSALPLKLEDAFSGKGMDDAHQAAVDSFWSKFSHPLSGQSVEPPKPAESTETPDATATE